MKILYAIQGTGNGHLSRAMDIIPCLQKHGEVDILVSGIQGDLSLPFPITYQYRGLSFIFGKSGGVNLWKTFARTNIRRFVKNFNDLPLDQYNLIINDFEPVSAWACYFKSKGCVGLSHQAAVLTEGYAVPDSVDRIGKLILEHYAPANTKYGFHFSGDGENIFTPVIRGQVRGHQVSNEGHYTVYLPSYDDKRLIKQLSVYENVNWEIFSKHNKKEYRSKNITIYPINNERFTASMASSAGVLCGAGFETPAEALFLGKKLLVIPMKNQYEQHLNAAALKAMGVQVLKNLKPKNEPIIRGWLEEGKVIPVDYPDITQEIIDRIVANHATRY
ncbi:MAG: glycosyl transferase [Sphingobacteriaceae bacterium]|nr:glycosyl transferase [Sphingobacteriaceae bacterium]